MTRIFWKDIIVGQAVKLTEECIEKFAAIYPAITDTPDDSFKVGNYLFIRDDNRFTIIPGDEFFKDFIFFPKDYEVSSSNQEPYEVPNELCPARQRLAFDQPRV